MQRQPVRDAWSFHLATNNVKELVTSTHNNKNITLANKKFANDPTEIIKCQINATTTITYVTLLYTAGTTEIIRKRSQQHHPVQVSISKQETIHPFVRVHRDDILRQVGVMQCFLPVPTNWGPRPTMQQETPRDSSFYRRFTPEFNYIVTF